MTPSHGRRPGVFAGLFVLVAPATTGFVTLAMTSYADCRQSMDTSCIPFQEIVFAAVVGTATFVWIAARLERGHDWIVDATAIVVSLGLWAAMMLPVIATVCRDMAVDEVCYDGLLAGIALVPVAVVVGHVVGRRAARRLPLAPGAT